MISHVAFGELVAQAEVRRTMVKYRYDSESK
jgi:hypothetical protein